MLFFIIIDLVTLQVLLTNADHVMRPTQFKGGFFFAIDAYSKGQIQKTPLNFYHILIYSITPVENDKFKSNMF